jgi:WD40 repeat protein
MGFDTLKEYIQGFILTIIVVVAGVTLLMNHLLMKDLAADISDASESGGPLLTCQTLYEGHSLDVVMLTASPRGVVVSVGLDRRIVVWKLRTMWQLPSKDIIRPTCPQHSLWPILAIALDEKGEWLAIAPKQGRVSIWSVKEATFKCSVAVGLGGHQPSAFFFGSQFYDTGPRLIVLRHDGWLSEICIKTGDSVHHRIFAGVVVSSSHGVFTPGLPLRIVTACQRGRIFVTSKMAGEWTSGQLDLFELPTIPPILPPSESCTILPLSALGMIVTSRSCSVDLVDLLSGMYLELNSNTFYVSAHLKNRQCDSNVSNGTVQTQLITGVPCQSPDMFVLRLSYSLVILHCIQRERIGNVYHAYIRFFTWPHARYLSSG